MTARRATLSVAGTFEERAVRREGDRELPLGPKARRTRAAILAVEQHATLAMEAARRVLFMEKGQVRFSGSAADLRGRDDLLRSVFLGAGR